MAGAVGSAGSCAEARGASARHQENIPHPLPTWEGDRKPPDPLPGYSHREPSAFLASRSVLPSPFQSPLPTIVSKTSQPLAACMLAPTHACSAIDPGLVTDENAVCWFCGS